MDFQKWREEYDSLSYEDHQKFYAQAYEEFPSQEHHTPEMFELFLFATRPKTVVEFGGWTGELAAKMLAKFPDIESWLNVEICVPAAKKSKEVVNDKRYESFVPDDFVWKTWDIKCDAFVAAHAIEHIKLRHLDALMGTVTAKHVFFEAPLLQPGQSWDGHEDDNHILEVGWDGVHTLMQNHGYELTAFFTTQKYGLENGFAQYTAAP